MNNWYVYIVKCSDGTLYTGSTTDVDARVRAHNAGRGAKYTRSRRPVKLIYREYAGDRGDALRREAGIKSLRKDQKIKLVFDG